MTIKPGEFVGIAGKNASGKTTLVRLLNGLILPTQGKVMIKEWTSVTVSCQKRKDARPSFRR